MDTSGQAAEQMVRYSIEGIEYALKFSGKGAERLAAILMAIAKDQQKTKGKTTLTAMLKSGKELTVFTIPETRLRDFALEAKRYGVLYCALREKNPQSNSLCDILVKAEDASKINRIVERLGLNQVEITAEAAQPVAEHTAEELEVRAAEDLLEQILSKPEQEKENPTSAQTEPLSPSGPGSTPSAEDIDFLPWDDIEPEETEAFFPRPSVRAALAAIRQEQSLMEVAELGMDIPALSEQDFEEFFGKDR